MKNGNNFEILVGFLVIVICTLFIFSSVKLSANREEISSGYKVIAEFDNVDGLNIGSEIKISGVKVGTVSNIILNKENYKAELSLKIAKDILVPTDSVFKVSTSGLIGNKFINIKIGADEDYLKNGDIVEFTESTMDLEDLISRFLFNSGNSDEKNN